LCHLPAASRTLIDELMNPQDLWPLFNLRDTPYFEEALRPGDGARYPVEWFVGRDLEALIVTAQEQDKLAALEKSEAVQNTRQLVRVFRETTGLSGGLSVSLLGGMSAGGSSTLNTPGTARPSILIAQLLRGLIHVARKQAAAIWKNERSRAARILAELHRAGYVLSLEQRASGEERGRPAALYGLSGSALLAFTAM
jgi:hypothetical protein